MTYLKKRLYIAITLAFVCICMSSFAQLSLGGEPFSYSTVFVLPSFAGGGGNNGDGSSSSVSIPDLDMNVINAELLQMHNGCEECKNGRYYGKEIEVNLNFFDHAISYPVDSGKVWLMNLASENAEGYQFLFNRFHLPEGGRLFIFNNDYSMKLGAFSSASHRDDGAFTTQYINGNDVYIEYFEPDSVQQQASIEIRAVVYIFSDCFSRYGPHHNPGAIVQDCHKNINCADQFSELAGVNIDIEKKSTVLILNGGTGQNAYWGCCSGNLINKASSYYTGTDNPFLLSANHCYQLEKGGYSQPSDWVFVFRHEGDYCDDTGNLVFMSDDKSVVGADIVSHDNVTKAADGKYYSDKSDWLLVKLKCKVSDIAGYDIAFAGWTSQETSITSSPYFLGVHHPEGDIKKMAVTTNIVSSGYDDKPGTKDHWKVIWQPDKGITQEGSSGSALFNSDHQIIGTLHGGKSRCDNLTAPDYYGKMSDAYKNGNFNTHLGGSSAWPSTGPWEGTITDYNLQVSFSYSPTNTPFTGQEFTITATPTNSTNKISWGWRASKVADDFEPYDDKSKYKEDTYEKSGSCSFSFTRQTKGIYRVTLSAIDFSSGKQLQKEWIFYVNQYTDPCMSAGLMSYYCMGANWDEYYIRKGSVLELDTWVNIPIGFHYYWDEFVQSCYPNVTTDGERYYPQYQGISSIEYYYNSGAQAGGKYVYTSTYECEMNTPANRKYFMDWQDRSCYNLTTQGEQTLSVKVTPGAWGDGTLFIGCHPPLNPVSNATIVAEKKVYVVDCDAETIIDTQTKLINTQNNLANYTFKDVIVNSGDNYEFEGFGTIVLGPGFEVEEGGRFYAKAKPYPPLINCSGCSGSKSAVTEAPEENMPVETINELEDSFTLYPNPTDIGRIIVASYNLKIIERVQVVGQQGAILLEISNINDGSRSIDVSSLLPGAYIMKIFSEGTFTTKTFIKQ